MTDVGRNDPCPCGSGRKFKKCCLGKTDALPSAFTRVERETALDRLARSSARQEFTQLRAFAEAEFWGEWLGRRSPDDLVRAMALDESRLAFNEWFVFDYRLPGGSTLIELLLDRAGNLLRTGEQRYLERMRLSHVRPYEVTRVRPDEGLDLRDLWTRETIRVQERRGTHQLVQWDLLVARVALGEHGVPVIDGFAYVLPATEAAPLLRRLKREHREFRREFPGADLATFFKQVAPVPFRLWLDRVALRPLPKMLSAEGDELLLAKTAFDILDGESLAAVLAAHPALEREDDGSYAWFEEVERARPPTGSTRSSGVTIHSERWPPAGGVRRRGLGTVLVERGRLILETMSKERAERGRRLLEEAAGGAVKYRATRYETVARAVGRAQGRPQAKEPDIPPKSRPRSSRSSWRSTIEPGRTSRCPRWATARRGRPRASSRCAPS